MQKYYYWDLIGMQNYLYYCIKNIFKAEREFEIIFELLKNIHII